MQMLFRCEVYKRVCPFSWKSWLTEVTSPETLQLNVCYACRFVFGPCFWNVDSQDDCEFDVQRRQSSVIKAMPDFEIRKISSLTERRMLCNLSVSWVRVVRLVNFTCLRHLQRPFVLRHDSFRCRLDLHLDFFSCTVLVTLISTFAFSCRCWPPFSTNCRMIMATKFRFCLRLSWCLTLDANHFFDSSRHRLHPKQKRQLSLEMTSMRITLLARISWLCSFPKNYHTIDFLE